MAVNSSRQLFRLGILSILLMVLAGYLFSSFIGLAIAPEVNAPELRGVWIRAELITSPEMIDEALRRAVAGHFNAVFIQVFPDGQALYDSALVSQYDKVEAGFDPLAYLVPAAHDLRLDVHAWFIVGRVGFAGTHPILVEHPDWGLIGPDGEMTGWLNFIRPDVRQFVGEIILETVERYEVDGLHFDYTRYPGPEWGFDPYSIEAFADQYNLDLNEMRYADLPAFGNFEGNPLINPRSAQVIATFSNGTPAVVLNQYGKGETVLLNWNATERLVAAGSEILQRAIQNLLQSGRRVYLLRSDTNAKEYGDEMFDLGFAWLNYLGWSPFEAREQDIENLTAGSVLVLPNVYIISPETAVALANFVQRGGGVIFLDGPARSIRLEEIKAITGMQSQGSYFNEPTLMTALIEHPLIPTSSRSTDIRMYQEWDDQWREFRMQGINTFIKDIHDLVKANHPGVTISATITSDQEVAVERYLQDWITWLEDGYVDFLVPKFFVAQVHDLESALAEWRPVTQERGHIVIGLKAYLNSGDTHISKDPEQLLTEIRIARLASSEGIMIFDLGRMTDEQLLALASGPFFASVTSTKERSVILLDR